MASSSSFKEQPKKLIPASNVHFECEDAYYSKYLGEFWYTAEADSTMNIITFTPSSFDKPLSFNLDDFSTVISLKLSRNCVSLSLKETVRAGLATLGLIDENDSTISSSDLANSYLSLIIEHLLKNYNNNENLKTFKPHHITISSFKTPSAFKVPLTSHMLKVAKIFEDHHKSLLPPFREVITDDTADKSSFETFVQPVTQPKAKTNKKLRRKKNPASSKPKASKISLKASESAEEQGNQLKTTDATKVQKLIDEEIVKVSNIFEEEVRDSEVTSLGNISLEELLAGHKNIKDDKEGVIGITPADQDMTHTDSELESMPRDKIMSVFGFKTTEIEDDDTQSQHKEEMSKSDELATDNSSLAQQTADKIEDFVPRLMADAFKERIPDLLADTLKNIFPQIIKDSSLAKTIKIKVGKSVMRSVKKEVTVILRKSEITSLGNISLEELLIGHKNKEDDKKGYKSPYNTKSKIKVVKIMNFKHTELEIKLSKKIVFDVADDDRVIDITLAEQDMSQTDFDLELIPEDEIVSVSGFKTTEIEDDDTQSQHREEMSKSDELATDNLSFLDPLGHFHKDLSYLTSRVKHLESSLAQQVADKIKDSVPILVADSFEERIPNLLAYTLKNIFPQIIKDSVKQALPDVKKEVTVVHELLRYCVTQLDKNDVNLHEFVNLISDMVALLDSASALVKAAPEGEKEST
ncbi:hypothetical protein Tco_1363479 [Tanacetum coccineum]